MVDQQENEQVSIEIAETFWNSSGKAKGSTSESFSVYGTTGDWVYVYDGVAYPRSPARGFIWFEDITFGKKD